MMCYTNNIIV